VSTILITGAAGFVGRHTVAELRRRGHNTVALVRPSRPLPAELRHPNVEIVHCDLRTADVALRDAVSRCGAVIHLAAGMSGSARARFDATVLGTERLIDAICDLDWDGRLVHVSSFAVYGFNQLRSRAVVDETTPLERQLDRRDDYAWLKSWQERLVSERLAEGPAEVTIVRPGAIYGPERPFQHRLGRRLGGRGLLLMGGASVMPLVYVDNVASLLAECAGNPLAAWQVFNAVDPDPPRQLTYLRRWLRAQPHRIWVLPLPLTAYSAAGAGLELAGRLSGGRIAPPGLLDRYAMIPNLRSFRYDTTKPATVLGWQPGVSPAEGIDRTFPGVAHA
jgi:nucleoside-diphosphate-sugar epimerase